MMRFEPHTHSDYSNTRLLDSINKVEKLIQTANDKGLAGIALTDHDLIMGHVHFLKAEKKLKEQKKIREDFVCALGNEIYLVNDKENIEKYFHFILIAKNKKGHEAIRKLTSLAWYNGYVKHKQYRTPVSYEELENVVNEYPNSLIATSACLGGELGKLVLELIELEKESYDINETITNKKLQIIDFINFHKKIFKDDFYIEIAPGKTKEQKEFNLKAISIARATDVKVVIGTDAHYYTKEDRWIHKAFLTSRQEEREVDSFYSTTYLMNEQEVFDIMKDQTQTELEVFFENSLEIMNKIERYDLKNNIVIPEEEVPYYDKKIQESEYKNIDWYLQSEDIQDRYWINKVLEQAKEKNIYNEEVLNRIDKEADIQHFISQELGDSMSKYHNTISLYIDLFWKCGSIVAPGRGSSSGWITNFLLGITQINPLTWGLNEWRYLNKERVEIGDIDLDIAPSKRREIFKQIRLKKGEQRVLQISTFKTEKTKSAILTSCRGYRTKEFPNGIDTDTAQYIASLIPQERGFLYTLDEVLYGDEEKGRKPVQAFINEIEKYEGLLEIIQSVEGLVSARSQHASGVILYNKDAYKTNAIMRSPNGDLTTQFSLHDCEYVGDTKFDFLVTEVIDKIIECVKLLQENDFIDSKLTLKEAYDKHLHPDAIDLNDNRLWDALAAGDILDVFQFNSGVGLEAAKRIEPKNPFEMTATNALFRLMAEKGMERPIDRYLRIKNNPQLWYDEMTAFGLSKNEQQLLIPYYEKDYGTPPYQESVMMILMDKNISHFSLTEANNARKIIGKKQMEKIPALKQLFFTKAKTIATEKLAEYVWRTAILPQLGYSFSINHSLPYSFVGIQTLLLGTMFPSVFWNCACLIVNSGGIEEIEIDDDDEDKKIKTVDYGKIAKAIGTMKEHGIKIELPNINYSNFTFSPIVENNSIAYGLKGINKIGDVVINNIIKNRPYTSLFDCIVRNKLTKPQVINLIKSGSFDSLYPDRKQIMKEYIKSICGQKKQLNLRNANMLIEQNLIPHKYDLQKKIFNFNKYLKKLKATVYNTEAFVFDEIAFNFYEKNCSLDKIEMLGNKPYIYKTVWKKIYDKHMSVIRDYIKLNHNMLLEKLNNLLYEDMWNKYSLGNLSKWEMDSISYYYHEHELENVNNDYYRLNDFYELNEEPELDRCIYIKNKKIPLFKLFKIAGTVLKKDKAKNTVTILTKEGVVDIKIWQNQFAKYDKQISEMQDTGKKKIVERSWFSRGNKLIFVGIRRGDTFVPKLYKNSKEKHMISLIEDIDEHGILRIKQGRTET